MLGSALGGLSHGLLNTYSGSMSFLALMVQLPLSPRRAILAISLGAIGFVLALTSLDAGGKYGNFLLLNTYWIAPWLGVFFTSAAPE